jgi:hypothetical protein
METKEFHSQKEWSMLCFALIDGIRARQELASTAEQLPKAVCRLLTNKKSGLSSLTEQRKKSRTFATFTRNPKQNLPTDTMTKKNYMYFVGALVRHRQKTAGHEPCRTERKKWHPHRETIRD